MRLMIVKINDPHGWVIAENIIDHYNDALYATTDPTNFSHKIDFKFPQNIDLNTLWQGLYYQFDMHSWANNLLILTEHTEEENQNIINMLKTIQLNNNPLCIIICNEFNNGGK